MEHRSTRIVVEGVVVAVGVAIFTWALWADDVWMATHTTRRYCFTDEATIVRAHAARWSVLALGIVVAVVVRPRVGRLLARRSPRALAGAVVRVVLAVALAFVATDAVLRVLRRPDPEPSVFGGRPLEVRASEWGGRTVHYAIETHGYRARDPDAAVDYALPTIVLSGESIVFGVGLEYDETIGARIAARTGLQAANLAHAGDAQDVTLRDLGTELPRFEHPVAVVEMVLTNWLERNVGQDRDHLVAGPDGSVVLAPPSTPAFLSRSPLFAALRIATRFHGDAVLEDTRAVLRATDAFIRSRGAYPLFVFSQAGDHCMTPFLRERITAGLSLSAIDVDLPPELMIAGDIHPVPKGAEVYADAIERALRAAGAAP